MRGMRAQAGRTGSSFPSSFFQSPHTSRECLLLSSLPSSSRANAVTVRQSTVCNGIHTHERGVCRASAAARGRPSLLPTPSRSHKNEAARSRMNDDSSLTTRRSVWRDISLSRWKMRLTRPFIGLWSISPAVALVREPAVCARLASATTRTQLRYVLTPSAAMERCRTLRSFQNTVQARAE